MNQDQINNHLQRFQRFQKSRELYFAPLINEALHKQYITVVNNIHLGIHAVNKIDSSGIMRIIRNLYMDAGIVYGAKIRADFVKEGHGFTQHGKQKSMGAIGFSERMASLISAYFKTDILNTSEGITQTTRDLIVAVFTNATQNGFSIDDIVREFEGTELSRVRARLIARTETVTATNKSALFVAQDTGLKLNKVWLATLDKRTRADHADVNGNQVGRDDYFNVGGFDMLVPGDRGGHDGKPFVDASEICNCRCTTLFRVVRDNAGRLVHA